MQLERRIRDLEGSAPQGEKLIGVPPIEFDYHAREAAFEADGFDLEQMNTPEKPVMTPGVAVLLDWDAARIRLKKEWALRDKLKSLRRAEQEKLARRAGYRVIYAPEGFTWEPRFNTRRP